MQRQPNVLLIMTDQLRHDCVGYAGGQPVQTPNIDALAAGGVRFEHAYSSIPTCCPARQAFLNTRYAESFGAYWNYDITFPIRALTPKEYSWPRELQQAGYRTSYFGKWHVNPEHDPREYGYDSYFGIGDYARYLEGKTVTGRYENAWRGEPDIVSLEDSRTHVLAARAADEIREASAEGRPWHVRLDFPEPHLPSRPAGDFARQYDPGQLPPWPNFGDTLEGKPFIQRQQLENWAVEGSAWSDWAPIVAMYFGVISQIDDAVGRVIATLKDTGEYENTIVLFTADHGDLCGAHGMVDKHYVMYDEVVRVPLLLTWPNGLTSPHSVSSFVSSTLDVGPTLLDLLGLDLPQETHGRSFRDLLERPMERDEPNKMVSTYNGAQFGLYCQRMLRTDRWKYIWNLTDVDELYDMEQDPAELTNLVNDPDRAGTLEELRASLYRELKEIADPLCKGPWVTGQLTGTSPLTNLEIPNTV